MRKLMWFTLGIALACGLLGYADFSIWVLPAALLGAVFLALVLTFRRNIPIAVLSGFLSGLVVCGSFYSCRLLPIISLDGSTVYAEITATDYGCETAYGSVCQGRVELDGKIYRAAVYLEPDQLLQPGDRVLGNFKLSYTGPGGSVDTPQNAGNGVFLLCYLRGDAQIQSRTEDCLEFSAVNFSYWLKLVIREIFPEDTGAFAKALVLGDTGELSYALDTALKISGIRHIVAVSGLHVAIVFGLFQTLTFKNRYLSALIGLPMAFLFAAVAGFSPSVTRATLMITLMILAKLCNREYDSLTGLSFAALVMLLSNPLVILSVSFQLSVGCVAGIILFAPGLQSWLEEKLGGIGGSGILSGCKRMLVSSVSVSLGSMSLTTPLCAYYFGTVSLVGVLTNLLTLWMISFIFIGIMAACLLFPLWYEASWAVAAAVSLPIRLVTGMAEWVSSFPMAAVYTVNPFICAWLIFIYVLLGAFLLMRHKAPRGLICAGVLGLLLAMGATLYESGLDEVRMTVMDVGQGQSILIQNEGKNILVDCGGYSDVTSANVAAGTLLSQGITRLDGLILTHCDFDHAAGAVNLLTRVGTDLLLMPATAKPEVAGALANGTDGDVMLVSQDMYLSFGDTEITVFAPIFLDDSNENSLCVLFDTKNCDILITGDRGRVGEYMLLRDHRLPDVDVLIAGHHGSKYSTSQALLEAVKPEVVIISVGEGNPYGHPAQETLDRLVAFGCRVYRTDLQGTIVFRR